jgi:hypothetical protein
MGLIYFVHEWQPKFDEAALLSDPEMLAAVTTINNQIIGLAPVLNSPTVEGLVSVSSDDESVPIATMVKKHNGTTYVFAVAMRGDKTTATFTLQRSENAKAVEVIGEDRTIDVENGAFKDDFQAWDVHLYKTKEF